MSSPIWAVSGVFTKLLRSQCRTHCRPTSSWRDFTIRLSSETEPSQLQGSLLCLLPPGEHSAPSPVSILEDEALLSAWVVRHGLLAEGSPGLLKFNGNFGSLAYVNLPPSSNVNSQVRHTQGLWLSWVFLHDDVLDNNRETGASAFAPIKSTHDVFGDILQDKYGRTGDQDLPFPHVDFPSFLPFCEALRDLHTTLHATIPFYSDRKDLFVREFISYFASYELSHGETPLASRDVSQESAKFWLRRASGFHFWMELLLLTRGVTLESDVRQDLYFLRLQEAGTDALSYINDIFGLAKDLQGDERDSLIIFKMREKSLDLNAAFQESLELVNEQLRDIRLLLRVLRRRYAGREEVGEFARALEDFIDGYVVWCVTCKRYGQLATTSLRTSPS